jgi:hypothetical protein
MSEAFLRDPLKTRPRYLSRGGFKTVELNVVGWSALIGAGLAAGAIVALTTPVPAMISLPVGVVSIWILLLIVDHFRWRNGEVGLSTDDLDPATGASIVARLEGMGVAARYREIDDEDEDGRPYTQRDIVCRQADAETVRRMLANRAID